MPEKPKSPAKTPDKRDPLVDAFEAKVKEAETELSMGAAEAKASIVSPPEDRLSKANKAKEESWGHLSIFLI